MKKPLYLCEKPSQARDIGRILGATSRHEGYLEGSQARVTWCLGHLLELAPPETYCEQLKPWRMSVLPVVPKDWTMCVKPKTKSQLRVIKQLLQQSDCVVVATDADREGDVIGREVLDWFKYPGKIQRMWLSALDDRSIQKALSALREGQSTYPLYQAGLGRQRADWLMGMNLTMATSSLYGKKGEGVLSVGRVQTPTLSLVVQRDHCIENFTARDYYDLWVAFQASDAPFRLKWQPSEDDTDEEGRCVKKNIAKAVEKKVVGQTGIVTQCDTKKKHIPPPLCFALSSLQKLCSSRFSMTAKDTLIVAQALYEKHKAITYPRTDSGYLPTDQFGEAPDILKGLLASDETLRPLIKICNVKVKSRVWNDKKITSHHGIIPTLQPTLALDALSKKERQVFDVIRRSYIAQFLGEYQYLSRTMTVNCQQEDFSATCTMPKSMGWRQAVNYEAAEEEKALLPELKIKTEVLAKEAELLAKQTKPPAYFTEGTLIAAMKNIAKFVEDVALKKVLRDNAGLGTEATRADIIEKLLNRGFILRDKKHLRSTPRGKYLMTIVPKQMKEAGTTALWEQTLDDIANGQGKLENFLLDQEEALGFMLNTLTKQHKQGVGMLSDGPLHKCPACESPLTKRKGKAGVFWGCTRFPDCKTTTPDKDGVPDFEAAAMPSTIECPTCHTGSLIKRKSKKGHYWWGCSHYPDCQASYWDRGGKPHLGTPQKT